MKQERARPPTPRLSSPDSYHALVSWETLILILFHAVLAPATALHALISKRDPRGAFGWIAVCVLFPLGGPLLYLFFGLNRARSKAQRLALGRWRVGFERGEHIETVQALPDSIRDPYRNLARIGQALSRHHLAVGNTVKMMINGEAAYPAMIEAIKGAESHILLTTYILDHDQTGQQFRQALVDASRRGVEVRVQIDGFGDWYSGRRASRALQRAGIRVSRFLPPRLIPPALSMNMRNHHKILIVDDRVGFTGGMNIGDRHRVDAPKNQTATADVHFQLNGPIVVQLRQEFLRMWHFTSGESDEPSAPNPPATGSLVCRTITDGPDQDLDRLTMLLIAALAEAKDSVRIMTPYFLPPRELIGALQAAALRGVEVNIVLPEKNNLPYLHWATRNMLWEVLFRGVRVFYQPAPFNHAKLFVVDGYYCLIGSANWDSRSLRLNFELQVEVYGEDLAAQLTAYIDQARGSGREVTLEEVDSRSLPVRLRDSICWLFTPYL